MQPKQPMPKLNNSRDSTIKNYMKTRNRLTAVDLYTAGKTQAQIAAVLDCTQPQVSVLLNEAKEIWQVESAKLLQDWLEQELAFCRQERLDILVLWRRTKNPKYNALLLRWTDRIAKLLGIDAPEKLEDWSHKDWRKFIHDQGLTEEEVKAEVVQLLAENNSA